jgi:hypothetical protein
LWAGDVTAPPFPRTVFLTTDAYAVVDAEDVFGNVEDATLDRAIPVRVWATVDALGDLH